MWEEPQKIPFQIFGVSFDAAHQRTKAKLSCFLGFFFLLPFLHIFGGKKGEKGTAPGSRHLGFALINRGTSKPKTQAVVPLFLISPPCRCFVLIFFSSFLFPSVLPLPAYITPFRKIKGVSRRRAERILVPDHAGRQSWPTVTDEELLKKYEEKQRCPSRCRLLSKSLPLPAANLSVCTQPSFPLLLPRVLLPCSPVCSASWLCKEDGQASS